MADQAEIHRMAQSRNVEERRKAVDELRYYFVTLPDKEKTWEDLHQSTLGIQPVVKWRTASAPVSESIFSHIPDEKQAWKDLIRLIQDKDGDVGNSASGVLSLAFRYISDKERAWEDLHQLVQNKYSIIRKRIASIVGSIFTLIPDRRQAWEDLHKLTQDKKENVRIRAIVALGTAFPYISDKGRAWEDLHRLINDVNETVRENAAIALSNNFLIVPDRKLAYDDLRWLLQDKNNNVRRKAIAGLYAIFPFIPDQEHAWKDVIQWILSEDRDVGSAVTSLVPESKYAQELINRLTKIKYIRIRRKAATALVSALSTLPDTRQTWEDLILLTLDEDSSIHSTTAYALRKAFPSVPDKEHAWKDLHGLIQNKNHNVRMGAVSALGTVFPLIPDKEQALKDLIQLTKDTNKYVRAYTNYSLGKVSIYKASETKSEENFRQELEMALEFFETSLKEVISFKPTGFCFPFYRSFYTITFRKQEAEEEIKKYLAEAKSAVKGSESKEKLLEAVENLFNALTETQKAVEINLEGKKCELNAYRRYCDRATELLEITQERAPGATKLIRKGLPIINQKIKETLQEIEEKVKKFCKESKQTPFEEISRSAYKQVEGLGKTENPVVVKIRLDGLIPLLHNMCNIFPKESMRVVCSQLDEIKEAELADNANIVLNVLRCIVIQQQNLKEKLTEKEKRIEYLEDEVLLRLDNISFGVSKLKIRSADMVQSLHEIKNKMDELKTIQTGLNEKGLSIENLEEKQQKKFNQLNNEITRLANEIETKVIPYLPHTDKVNNIIEEIHKLKQCREEMWFNRGAGLASIIGLILTIL